MFTDEGEPRARHLYDDPDTYTIKVTVTDNDGAQRSRKARVVVSEPAAGGGDDAPAEGVEDDTAGQSTRSTGFES